MFDLSNLASYRENNRLEAKDARGGFPKSFWETYSAFANTEGGLIVLGVQELADGSLVANGLEDTERYVKTLWDAVNNRSRVSANVLTESDVTVETLDGASVLSVWVPRAQREQRPVYINGNPLVGTYRRNGSGDYRCSEEEYRAMVRDSADGSSDGLLLPNMLNDALCPETISAFSAELSIVRPRHPWLRLGTDDLLVRLGAMKRSPEDSRLHPTRAGLLMFGYEYRIVEEFPYYFLDYREETGRRRWEDRIVASDGEWSGNVFDFWRRVHSKLMEVPRRAFELDSAARRIDETPMHDALREALANTLIHADYYGRGNVTIVRRVNEVVFENPGGLRVPVEVVLGGGVSDARNPTLMKMFNLIAVGERAGSGFDAMKMGCISAGLPLPDLRESFGPDRTHLVFHLTRAPRAENTAVSQKMDDDAGQVERYSVSPAETIVCYLQEHAAISRKEVEGLLGIGSTKAKSLLSDMVEHGELLVEGAARSTRYKLP